MKPARFVLDASIVVPVSLELPEAIGFLALLEASEEVFAPSLLLLETANALATLATARRIESRTAELAWKRGLSFVSRFVPDEELVREALPLALAHRHPVYDCLYAALAIRLGLPVFTNDRRLRRLLETVGVGSVPSV